MERWRKGVMERGVGSDVTRFAGSDAVPRLRYSNAPFSGPLQALILFGSRCMFHFFGFEFSLVRPAAASFGSE
jgi:hypothetical protein